MITLREKQKGPTISIGKSQQSQQWYQWIHVFKHTRIGSRKLYIFLKQKVSYSRKFYRIGSKIYDKKEQ